MSRLLLRIGCRVWLMRLFLPSQGQGLKPRTRAQQFLYFADFSKCPPNS